jgi:hypothetical protein
LNHCALSHRTVSTMHSARIIGIIRPNKGVNLMSLMGQARQTRILQSPSRGKSLYGNEMLREALCFLAPNQSDMGHRGYWWNSSGSPMLWLSKPWDSRFIHHMGTALPPQLRINPTKSSILRGPHSVGGVLTPPLAKGMLRSLGTPASCSPQ